MIMISCITILTDYCLEDDSQGDNTMKFRVNEGLAWDFELSQKVTPYIYQYRYEYLFPEDQQATLSEAFRTMTGMDGNYKGVAWLYTYYTYFDPSINDYIPWENPDQENQNNGFLIYPITEVDSAAFSLDEIYSSTYSTELEELYQLTFDLQGRIFANGMLEITGKLRISLKGIRLV
jgi:hypothetical protein